MAFPKKSLITVLAAIISSTAVFFLLPTPAPKPQDGNSFAIRNVRVFDGAQTLEDADLVVENGLIKVVRSEERRVGKQCR